MKKFLNLVRTFAIIALVLGATVFGHAHIPFPPSTMYVKFDGKIRSFVCAEKALEWEADSKGAVQREGLDGNPDPNGPVVHILIRNKETSTPPWIWEQNRARLDARIERSSKKACDEPEEQEERKENIEALAFIFAPINLVQGGQGGQGGNVTINLGDSLRNAAAPAATAKAPKVRNTHLLAGGFMPFRKNADGKQNGAGGMIGIQKGTLARGFGANLLLGFSGEGARMDFLWGFGANGSSKVAEFGDFHILVGAEGQFLTGFSRTELPDGMAQYYSTENTTVKTDGAPTTTVDREWYDEVPILNRVAYSTSPNEVVMLGKFGARWQQSGADTDPVSIMLIGGTSQAKDFLFGGEMGLGDGFNVQVITNGKGDFRFAATVTFGGGGK